MLVLSRKRNQSIMIGDDVEIVIVSVDRDQVKLGIKAPREIAVHRSEVYQEIKQANEAAVAASRDHSHSQGASGVVLSSAESRRLLPSDESSPEQEASIS